MLLRHVSERSFRRQGRPGAGVSIVHNGGYGTARHDDGPRAVTEGRLCYLCPAPHDFLILKLGRPVFQFF